MTQLTDPGRRIRVLLTLVGALVLLAGTLWGQDDDFPFGPFRMFSTAPAPNQPAQDTRVEGVDTTGKVVSLTEGNSGIRRAEIEGQMRGYESDPSRLSEVATAYGDRTPGAAPLRVVRIVIRWQGVEHSRPTGKWTDQVVATWTRP